MESMRKVLVYNSGTGSWYGQVTTAEGDFPPGRWSFCAVAASAPDNSSHAIYIYGGESPSAVRSSYSDMWILSIPSFRWIRVDVQSTPRKAHGCTAVAERYMLTYGGTKAGFGNEGDTNGCDQKNYGLQLFDLSWLAWTSRYEGPSKGNAYKVPKSVYDVIGGDSEGRATQTAPAVGFETPSLSSLFRASIMVSTSPVTTTSSPTSSPSPPEAKHTTSIATIVGVAISAVAGIALVLTGVFCLVKRRKHHAPPQPNIHEAEGQSTHRTELPDSKRGPSHNVYELYGAPNLPPQEMFAGNDAH
jgi:hypothetical protein